MNIALMNEKITIQRNTPTVDEIGNHISDWQDYFSCYATVGGEESSVSGETEAAGQTISDAKASFTVRWCDALSGINSTEYRVLFRGDLYDITGIDHLNYKKKALKLLCRRCRR